MAFVGQDDPTFVDDVRRALEEAGVRSRVLGLSSLKIAARPPDLTVMIGDAAEDGGVAVIDEVGLERGPFAIIVPHGKLAARLEARQRGIEIIPRKATGVEVAAEVERILDKLGEGEPAMASVPVENLLRTAASELAKRTGAPHLGQVKVRAGDEAKARALLDRFVGEIASLTERGPATQEPVSLSGLDWDDDPETVQKHDAGVEAWRDSKVPKPPRPSNAAARMIGKRSTMPGGISRFPAAAAVLAATPEDDVTDPQQAPLKLGDVHEAVTRPHVLPEARSPGQGPPALPSSPKLLGSPGPGLELQDETREEGFEDELETIDSSASELLAASMTELSGDPDTTARHRPVALRPPGYADAESDADATSRQDAQPIAPPPSAPSVPSDPPPAMAPQPPAAAVPVAPPAPSVPRVQAPQTASAPPKKSGGLGLVMGVAAVVFGIGVVGAGGVYWFVLRDGLPDGVASAEAPTPDEPATPVAATPPAAEQAPPPPSDDEPLAEETGAAAAEPVDEQADEQADEQVDEPEADETAPSAPPEALSPEEARAQSDVHVDEAREHRRNNRLPEARAAFESAIEVHEANPHAHAGLARLALDLGESELALEHAERAAALRRRRARYQLLLGDARLANGDRGGARRAWERAADMDPDDPEALQRLGE